MLMRYNWPGNIRELENSIERAILMTESQFIGSDDLRLGEIVSTAANGVRRPRRSSRFRRRGYPRRDRAQRADGSAQDVQLGSERRCGAAGDQPASDELQDQDARIEFPRSRRPMVAAVSS
jgi:DNA-binding NtrC family response regulator